MDPHPGEEVERVVVAVDRAQRRAAERAADPRLVPGSGVAGGG